MAETAIKAAAVMPAVAKIATEQMPITMYFVRGSTGLGVIVN